MFGNNLSKEVISSGSLGCAGFRRFDNAPPGSFTLIVAHVLGKLSVNEKRLVAPVNAAGIAR